MKYQAYPEYMDSGVEWLGEIPICWDTWKFKHVLLEPMIYGANEAALDNDRKNPRYIRITDMNPDGSLREETFKSLPYLIAENYLLADDDILLARSGGTVGKSFLFKKEFGVCCFAGYLIRAKCNIHAALPRYIYWFCQSDSYWKYISGSQIQATIQNVSAEKYGAMKLPLPQDVSEQIQIANFLDHETAKIDELIEKQQQLIKLLKEKRQAVISHAVTKGLNPNAPMRNSGVEWLGKVPKHWKIKRVGYACQIDNNLRTPIDKQTRMVIPGNYPYYGPTGILNLIDKYNVEGEYFLLGEDGDHFLKFKEKSMTIHVRGKFNVNNHAHLIKGKDTCSTRWGCLYFEYMDLSPWLIKQGVSRYKLRKESLVEIPMLVPPENEQNLILSEVDKRRSTFNTIIGKTEYFITTLRERRTALISAAVTGKIDVRNWQAPTNSA